MASSVADGEDFSPGFARASYSLSAALLCYRGVGADVQLARVAARQEQQRWLAGYLTSVAALDILSTSSPAAGCGQLPSPALLSALRSRAARLVDLCGLRPSGTCTPSADLMVST